MQSGSCQIISITVALSSTSAAIVTSRKLLTYETENLSRPGPSLNRKFGHENKDFTECIHQKRRTFTNFTKRHTTANFPQENEEKKIIGIDKNLKIRLEEWKVQRPCFKCKYEEQRVKDNDSKTIKRCSTTLSLIESIPGITMSVWKQNIVWFLVNTEPEASSDEGFRLFERQNPLPFD